MPEQLNRDTYQGIFNFDLFHEEISILRSQKDAKYGFCINIRRFISDHYNLWTDYHSSALNDIILILAHELYEKMGACIDPDGNVIIPPIEKGKRTKETETSIRDLAKECLEKSHTPLPLPELLYYVNSRRSSSTSEESLYSSLLQAKDIFVKFTEKRFGLCSVDYPEAYSTTYQKVNTC